MVQLLPLVSHNIILSAKYPWWKNVNLPSPSFQLSSGKISYWDNWLYLNIPTSKRIRLRGLFLWPRRFLQAVSREAAPSPGVPSKLLNVPHAVAESFIAFSVWVIALPSSVILNPRWLHPFIMLFYNNYSRYLFGVGTALCVTRLWF